MPHMPETECNALIQELKRAQTYLEFGMGGSTTLAARIGVPNIISVDSSKEWVDNILLQISQLELKGSVQLLHANLGETGDWGYPKNSDGIANWPSYYAGPWIVVRQKKIDPDLILIDGRFRVACFLFSLLNLKAGSTILWDDYLLRPEYHRVEEYLAPEEMHGGMALFRVPDVKDTGAIVTGLFTNLYDLG